MKKTEEHQFFLVFSCHWGRFGGYSYTWIFFNIYLSTIYSISYMVRYTKKQKCVPPNITRSTKLWDAQRSSELTFRSKDFVPESLFFPVLKKAESNFLILVSLGGTIMVCTGEKFLKIHLFFKTHLFCKLLTNETNFPLCTFKEKLLQDASSMHLLKICMNHP